MPKKDSTAEREEKRTERRRERREMGKQTDPPEARLSKVNSKIIFFSSFSPLSKKKERKFYFRVQIREFLQSLKTASVIVLREISSECSGLPRGCRLWIKRAQRSIIISLSLNVLLSKRGKMMRRMQAK